MPKYTKYIIVVLALASLLLGTVGCCLLLPPASNTTTPEPADSSSAHTSASWTFPPETGSPTTSLPDFPPVIAKVVPSVVAVITERVVSSFFGEYTQSGEGSGVIIDAEGYIVTNNHVVEEAHSVEVERYDGRIFPAVIVGTDPMTDLAVLKIDAPDLAYATWGDSSQLALGNWVIAIGNSLGEGISASQGIVSRLNVALSVDGNALRGLIQTTAPINPGNSGGPLVDMSYQVIGITSAKMAAVGVEGMGYAISSNSAKPIIKDLIRYGRITRPWLGVSLYTVDSFVAAANNLSVDHGALIMEVVKGSPADAAGLDKGDIIIRFKDKDIANIDDLIQAIQSSEIGENVEIVFVRGTETRTTRAILQETPSPWG